MSRIIFNQITGHCDFTKLTQKMNHHSLFIVMGKLEGGWIYLIFDVICPCGHLLWQLRPLSSLSCLPDLQVCGLVCSCERRRNLPLNSWYKQSVAPSASQRRGHSQVSSASPELWQLETPNLQRSPSIPSILSLCSPSTPSTQPAHLGNSFPVSICIILSAFCLNPLHCHKRIEFLNLKTRSYRDFLCDYCCCVLVCVFPSPRAAPFLAVCFQEWQE